MRFPPAIIDIKRIQHGRKKLRLYLPVFLLWPLALIVLAVLTPVLIVLGILYPFAQSVRRLFQKLYAGIAFACSLRGLSLAIEKETKTIQVNII